MMFVIKGFAYFVSKNLTYTLKVPPETHAVILNRDITQFGNKLVKN